MRKQALVDVWGAAIMKGLLPFIDARNQLHFIDFRWESA
jgi:hypothetical protein